jgi:hypothetical protein
MTEPSDYEVRVSRRARHARLSVSYAGRVTVIIPERFPRSKVSAIVDANRTWIERAKRRFAAEGALIVDRFAPERPQHLMLRLLGQDLPVIYHHGAGPARAVERAGQLYVAADDENEDAQRQALKRYLARRARRELEPRLDAMAAEIGVQVHGVSIRAQQTRWGSCSPSGSISLNSALLFLPEALVHYVLLHELCHRRELNHSPRFWALLTQLEPDSDRLRKELKSAWHFVPAWLGA